MAKISSTPLEQTSRLLDLVPFLLSHQGISLTDLSKHFNVEDDVMLDDLNTLWMCGLPGYTPLELIDLEFDSGFVTIRNAAPLDYIRTMSSSELVALALGLDLLLEDSLELTVDNRERIEVLSQKLRKQIGAQISIAPSLQTTHRTVIAAAIAQRKPVKMTYYSPSTDQSTDRIVTAYHFFHQTDVEYFQGYCHTSMGMRTFRLDRILSADLTEPALTISDVAREVGAIIRVQARIERADRATAESFGLSFDAMDVGSHIELEAFSQDWLVRTILAAESSLVVVEPRQIRESIRLSIAESLALYE